MPRLLHTADWRLGHVPPELEDGASRFQAVERLAHLAHAERVDVVVVAGNALDDHDVDEEVVADTRRALGAFAPTPVLLVPGDRDAAEAEGIFERLGPLPHIHVLRERGALDIGGLCVTACPRSRRHSDEDPLAGLSLPASSLPRVVVAHGLAHGMRGETVDRLTPARAAGADWLALGGTASAVRLGTHGAWCGTPEPWGFETPGHALLIDLRVGEAPQVAEHAVAVTTWLRRDVEVNGHDDLEALRAWLATQPTPLVAHLRLRGKVPADVPRDLHRPGVHLLLDDELRLQAHDTAAPDGLAAQAMRRLLDRDDRVGELAAAKLLQWMKGDA